MLNFNRASILSYNEDYNTLHIQIIMKQTLVSVIAAASMTIIAPNFTFAQDEISWIEVNLETPGTLGVEVLYKVDKLSDVTALRITGSINSDDWATIKNMPLQHLDLSGALSTSIPDEQFKSKQIKTALLPENLTTIGNKAFYQSQITEIAFPAYLNSIGTEAFYGCQSLKNVSFTEGSQLKVIGNSCFYQCTALTSVQNLNNTQLSEISSYCFAYCSALKEIALPETITYLSNKSFYRASSLTNLNFPENLNSIGEYCCCETGLESAILPEHLRSIGKQAFNSSQLTEVVLPADVLSYDSNQFTNIPTLTKVTCPCATPPSGTGISINSGATLIVPEISVVNYKLSSFWMNFSDIQGTLSPDYYNINSEWQLTNNRRPSGTPDVVLGAYGKLTIGGNAAFNLNSLTLNTDYYRYYNDNSYDTYSQLISNCPAVTAKEISMNFRPYGYSSNRWTFFSIPYDVNMSDITVNNDCSYVIRYYDGAERAASGMGKSWKDVPADGKLEAGKGYILMANGDCTFRFPAADAKTLFDPNAHVFTLDANEAEDAAHAGWNLVGNPYASCYDMYYTMLTSPVTVWNHHNNQYVAYSLIDDDLVLRPYQNFFIQAGTELTEVNFGTLGRQFTMDVNRTSAATARSKGGILTERQLFNLSIAKGDSKDCTRVVLNEEASTDYEYNRDAAKFFGEAPVQFYTIDENGTPLAINERPYADGIVNFGIYLEEAGEFTITADRIDGVATLFDALTGKNYKLIEGTSVVLESEAGYIEDRFSLALDPSVTTRVNGVAQSSTYISVEGNTITVFGADGAAINIYTIDGKDVANGIATEKAAQFTLPQGIYIVKTGTTTAKCIIK